MVPVINEDGQQIPEGNAVADAGAGRRGGMDFVRQVEFVELSAS